MKKLKTEQSYSKVRLMLVLKTTILALMLLKKASFLFFSYQNIEIITAVDCNKKELSGSVEQDKSVGW